MWYAGLHLLLLCRYVKNANGRDMQKLSENVFDFHLVITETAYIQCILILFT